jgi:hypothetical protein
LCHFEVVHETWEKKQCVGTAAVASRDYSLYTSVLGTAFLLFWAYLVTSKEELFIHGCIF